MLLIKISNEKVFNSNICATKFLIILLLIFILPLISYGQRYPGGVNPYEKETDDRENSNKVLTSISLKLANITNVYGTELGASVNLLMDKKISIGFEFFSLLSDNAGVKVDEKNSITISYGYAGATFGYYYFPLDWLMLTPNLLCGISRITNKSSTIGFGIPNLSEDWYGLFEAKATLGIKIVKSIWIGIFAGYRYSYGVKFYTITNKDLTGTIFGISFITF